jgi:UDPglucose--hexose-1-phosphate uridylyltransferase
LQEFRKDPITGRWVIISTDRARRPHAFSPDTPRSLGVGPSPFVVGQEAQTQPELLAYHHGEGGAWSLRVVPNRYPALRVEGVMEHQGEGMYDQMSGIGAHEVIIETPDANVALTDLPEARIADLFWAFRDRVNDLKRDIRLRYMVMFKNYGESAGATIRHSHSQLIALPVVPRITEEEIAGGKRYFDYRNRCIYCDILKQEQQTATRMVTSNDGFVALAPYASRFPFETWVLPRRHASHFESVTDPEVRQLAGTMKQVLQRLDKALEKPAYNFVIHTTPVQDPAIEHYHWHIEIIPRVVRVAGFEWSTGMYINPTAPEEAAAFLRDARP